MLLNHLPPGGDNDEENADEDEDEEDEDKDDNDNSEVTSSMYGSGWENDEAEYGDGDEM